MAYTLIWSEDAQENVHQILDYLLDSWGDAIADQFSERLIKAGRQLENMPYSGTRHRQLSAVRELRILPHQTVYYTVIEKDREIFILNIRDQRMST
jgi:plasmid stabilization system protein ParE